MVMRRDGGGLLPTDAINTRRMVSPDGVPSPGADNSGLETAISSLSRGLKELIAAVGSGIGSGAGLPSGVIQPFGQPVQFETVNLTAAHPGTEIAVAAGYTYCQAWCDGNMDGITVKLGSQSNVGIDLSRYPGFPIPPGVNKVYITNDVRPGRSVLMLGFGYGESMRTVDMQSELHELAARLGSPVAYDRRGRIVWSDDFDGLQLRWVPTVTAGVGDVGLTSALPYCGDQCCHMKTGAVLNDYTAITRGMYLPLDKNLGFQSAFRLDSSWDNAYLDFQMLLYDGTNLHLASLRVNSTGAVWTGQYYTSAGGWTSALTTWSPRVSSTWHQIKMVVDFTNGLMVRGLIDNNVIDLSAIPTNKTADTTQALDLRIKLTTLGAASRECWIDNVILTDCEPVDILH